MLIIYCFYAVFRDDGVAVNFECGIYRLLAWSSILVGEKSDFYHISDDLRKLATRQYNLPLL